MSKNTFFTEHLRTAATVDDNSFYIFKLFYFKPALISQFLKLMSWLRIHHNYRTMYLIFELCEINSNLILVEVSQSINLWIYRRE